MAKKHTTDELIESVRRRANLPRSRSLFDDDDIIAYLNEELRNTVVPTTLECMEEYLVYSSDLTTVPGTQFYQLPSGAVASGLRDVVLVRDDGVEYKIAYASLDQVSTYGVRIDSGSLFHFFQGNHLIGFYPTPQTEMQIKLKYYRQPSELIKESDAAQITSVTSTQIIVNDTLDLDVGDTMEFNQHKTPFASLGSAVITAKPTAYTYTFAAVPDYVVKNNWVSEEGTSPVVNLPLVAESFLLQSTVLKVVNTTGDNEQAITEGKIFDQVKKDYISLLSPRGDGSTKSVGGGPNISDYLNTGYWSRWRG